MRLVIQISQIIIVLIFVFLLSPSLALPWNDAGASTPATTVIPAIVVVDSLSNAEIVLVLPERYGECRYIGGKGDAWTLGDIPLFTENSYANMDADGYDYVFYFKRGHFNNVHFRLECGPRIQVRIRGRVKGMDTKVR